MRSNTIPEREAIFEEILIKCGVDCSISRTAAQEISNIVSPALDVDEYGELLYNEEHLLDMVDHGQLTSIDVLGQQMYSIGFKDGRASVLGAYADSYEEEPIDPEEI